MKPLRMLLGQATEAARQDCKASRRSWDYFFILERQPVSARRGRVERYMSLRMCVVDE